jgi:NIMA (never in mitosis gene a)-related kinase
MIDKGKICSTSHFSSKYKELKLLGEGSYGTAILVRSTQDKSLAVIKQIDLTKLTPEKRQIAFQEGKILETFEHPNIIHFREFYFDKNFVYIVMDYADGGDLSIKIKQQREKNTFFQEDLILNWFTQICLAIKHIHDRKILHRDIKSQNIFLTKEGLVKLGDFGIAKCLDTTLDKAKTLIGTPYYLSPEIINDQPYDFSSDIWALGVLLYEMCDLKMPFEGKNLPQLYMKIANGSFPPLNNKNLSKDLKNLVNCLLNVDCKMRPTIHEILKKNIIQNRIKNFLSEMEFNNEFSHTILHNYNVKDNNKIHELKNGKNRNNGNNKKDEKLTVSNSSYSNNNNGNSFFKNKDKDKEREIYILKKDLLPNNNNNSNNNNSNIQKINNRIYLNNNKIENNLYNYHKARPESEKRKIEFINNNNYLNPLSKNIKKEFSERIIRRGNSDNNSINKEINQESRNSLSNNKLNYERNRNSKDKNQFKNLIDQINDKIQNHSQNPMNEIDQFLENQNLKNSYSKYSNSSKKLEEKNLKNEKDINDYFEHKNNLDYQNTKNEKNDSFELSNNEENDISYFNYKKQIGSTNASSINENNIDQNVINELNSELGKDIFLDMVDIIKKNMNDEMISYDYEQIIKNIRDNYIKKNLPKIAIERAIIKIPEIYFLILRKKI